MTKEFIIRREVKEYIDSAIVYCDFIESTETINSVEFLTKIRLLLLTLYQQGFMFPLYNGNSQPDTEDLLGESYFIVLKKIAQKIGNTNFYTHMYDPTNSKDDKPVVGALSDDLGDIYRDLKGAILQLDLDSETARARALWDLHFLFRNHYAEHIINALYAIHFFLQFE